MLYCPKMRNIMKSPERPIIFGIITGLCLVFVCLPISGVSLFQGCSEPDTVDPPPTQKIDDVIDTIKPPALVEYDWSKRSEYIEQYESILHKLDILDAMLEKYESKPLISYEASARYMRSIVAIQEIRMQVLYYLWTISLTDYNVEERVEPDLPQ